MHCQISIIIIEEERASPVPVVHSASTGYEDTAWLDSLARLRMAARQWQTAFWFLCHTKYCMV